MTKIIFQMISNLYTMAFTIVATSQDQVITISTINAVIITDAIYSPQLCMESGSAFNYQR